MTAHAQPGENALRDRIHQVINDRCAADGDCPRCRGVRDAVMAEVKPELDRLRAENTRFRDRLRTANRLRRDARRAEDAERHCAENAKREADVLRDCVLAYADQLHGYCSPHGVAAIYAEQLRNVVTKGTTE